jgi:hypothetical protein
VQLLGILYLTCVLAALIPADVRRRADAAKSCPSCCRYYPDLDVNADNDGKPPRETGRRDKADQNISGPAGSAPRARAVWQARNGLDSGMSGGGHGASAGDVQGQFRPRGRPMSGCERALAA